MKHILNYNKFTLNEAKNIFNKYGLLHITNTGMTNLKDMKSIVDLFIEESMNYDGGANNRNYITKNVYDVGAPIESEIMFHHEMAYVNRTPSKLSFCVEKMPSNKGWTYVSDQIALTKELMKTSFGKKLFDKGVCYKRILTNKDFYQGNTEGIYNHWQDSFNTEIQKQAEILAIKQGLEFEWVNNEMVTYYHQDAYEYCPMTKNNILFSSLADHNMWFDTWSAFKNVKPEDRPLQMTYGDMTSFTKDEIDLWLHLYDKYAFPIRWKVGDVSIICNYRWAHGRPAIKLEQGEERNLGVILGDVFQRQGQKEI